MRVGRLLLLITGASGFAVAEAGPWHFDRRTDPQTGERTLAVSVTSGSLTTTQTLVARCSRGTLEAYVSFGEHLGEEPVAVKYQVDEQSIVEETWLLSAKGTAAFADDDRQFLMRMRNGRSFVIDARTQSGQSHRAAFDIKGAELPVGEVLNKCRTSNGTLGRAIPSLRPEIAKDLDRWGPKSINVYKRVLTARRLYSGPLDSTIEPEFALAVQTAYDDYLRRCKLGDIQGSFTCDMLRQAWERGAVEPVPPVPYLVMQEEAPPELKAEAGKLSVLE